MKGVDNHMARHTQLHNNADLEKNASLGSASHQDWIDDTIAKHADMVYRIAFTQMKNKADADDMFQEVFVRLCQATVRFESDEHVKAWLIRVTINMCRKSFATAWHRKVTGMPETPPDQLVHWDDTLGDQTLSTAVASLPQKYRTVIHLFYFEDMSIQDIAAALKSTTGTVKSQLSRARSLLKDKLEGDYHDF